MVEAFEMTEINNTIDRIETIQNCVDTIRKLLFNIDVQLEAIREQKKSYGVKT